MERLHLTNDIKAVYTQGMKLLHPCLRLYVLSNPKVSRFTVVVAKHVSKQAVDRNTIKRRVRAQLRPMENRFKRPVDLVIVGQSKSLNASSEQLREALEQLLIKAKVL